MSKNDDKASVESSLRLGNGFKASERDRIVAGWGKLTSSPGVIPPRLGRAGAFGQGAWDAEPAHGA